MDEMNLFGTKLSANTPTKISLSSIDPEIIPAIRELKQNSAEYKQLKQAIEKDGQKQPIIVRKLTDEEKSKTKAEEAEYGIIDGNHRFRIAKELKKENILAIIDTGEVSPIRDMILAMRFNVSSIKMSSLQKGEVIYKIFKSTNTESNKEVIKEIGSKLFGFKAAMTYRCLQKYRISIGEATVEKPRDNNFDVNQIRNLAQGLPENMENISADEGLRQLENIKSIEQQLNYLKNEIKSIDSVKEALKQQQQEKLKAAREKKKS